MNDANGNVPVIPLWDLYLVPLQGDIHDSQAASLSETVLARIARSGARGLIFDVSGVEMMDSHLCALLADVAKAAGLMGTPTTLCGVKPEIALTLHSMGVELDVESALTLEEALERHGVVDTARDGKRSWQTLADSLLEETA